MHTWKTYIKNFPRKIVQEQEEILVQRKSLNEILKKSDLISSTLVEDIDTRGWKKVSQQMGSNPGGTYKDHVGQEWYVKHAKSEEHARNEMLANDLYHHLGVSTLHPQYVSSEHGLGTASRIQKLNNFDPNNEDHRKEAAHHFASHAFVANWDTIGMGFDNQSRVHGKMTTLDAGGALKFRAQGGPKGDAFGHKATEWDTFRNPKMNETSAHVFGQMTGPEMHESSKAVANLSNNTIDHLVKKHGFGPDLTTKLINRKKDIISRANSLASQHNLPKLRDIDDEIA